MSHTGPTKDCGRPEPGKADASTDDIYAAMDWLATARTQRQGLT
jgi:hypothetical protein